jgi:uncharacterized DUF497 family protein
MILYWDWHNVDHIAEHDVDREEAGEVLGSSRSPYPKQLPEGKYVVWGQTHSGRYLQVMYILPKDEHIDPTRLSPADRIKWMDGDDEVAYVIHARDLSDGEKRLLKRLRR